MAIGATTFWQRIATADVQSRARAGRADDRPGCATLSRPPAQWALPGWIAGPPARVLVVAIGLACFTLSWLWAADSYSASIMTARLLASSRPSARAAATIVHAPGRIVDSLDAAAPGPLGDIHEPGGTGHGTVALGGQIAVESRAGGLAGKPDGSAGAGPARSKPATLRRFPRELWA